MHIFKNFPGKHVPGPPLELFLFLHQLQIGSAEKIKRSKKCENYGLPLLKFLATPLVGLIYPVHTSNLCGLVAMGCLHHS